MRKVFPGNGKDRILERPPAVGYADRGWRRFGGADRLAITIPDRRCVIASL
jgi:hypothetical protein